MELGREALSEVQAPKRATMGSEWSTGYRSPREGDGGLGRGRPPGGFSPGFPGETETRERVESSPRRLGPQYSSATRNWFTGAGTSQCPAANMARINHLCPNHPFTRALPRIPPGER